MWKMTRKFKERRRSQHDVVTGTIRTGFGRKKEFITGPGRRSIQEKRTPITSKTRKASW
jgi:hypothetical protein